MTTEIDSGDFKDYSSKRLRIVLAKQEAFINEAGIPGTSLFKVVMIGDEEITVNGRTFQRQIFLKGENVVKGFQMIVNGIRADIAENQCQE